jgi:NAD(P)-dependent dehydrogenase (short-subunit alcohol dehydrogenase family)
MAATELRDRVVVITGASSGFGKGAARAFANADCCVVLAARRDALLDELAREIGAAGGRAIAVPTDVSVPEDVETLTARALETWGRIDVWVNNAGVGGIGRFEDTPLDVQEQVIRTDLLGVLYGSWYAWQQFLEQGHGVLINIASELGQHTVPYYAAYTAAKHGVVGLTQSLRQELELAGEEAIHVCLVMPTAHDTPFFEHAANYTGREVQPPKPLHDPANVVAAIVDLARDPRDEKIVGADGVAKVIMKRLLPGVEESVSARQMDQTVYGDNPPAPVSPGAVREPMQKGTEVSAEHNR